jgi:plasmid stability protein
MGQIVVRGIPEGDMEALDGRARRLGRSREQEVRLLIARAAAEERGWSEFRARSTELRRRLEGRSFGDSADVVRSDRDAG